MYLNTSNLNVLRPLIAGLFSLLAMSCLMDVNVDVENHIPAPLASADSTKVASKTSPLDDIWINVKKWHGGKKAAVALTYDIPYHEYPAIMQSVQEVITRNMRMDMELISHQYETTNLKQFIPFMRDSLINAGVKFFGHGHKHIPHDYLGI